MKVVVFHPNFGIGGAERLTLDAAQAFRKKNYDVHIVTNFFSKDHCFNDLLTFSKSFLAFLISNYLDINVINCFPHSIFGKFKALCAYIHFCLAAIFVCVKHSNADIIFCDLISAPIFLFRLFLKAKILFYCHYPDQLMTERKSLFKKIYRYFIDRIENWTTAMAHVIFVNSKYTKNVFRKTFTSMASKKIQILYPSLNVDNIDNLVNSLITNQHKDKECLKFRYTFLSINRFEKKKNIELAIEAFALLRKDLSPEIFSQCLLVLAGGYDKLNSENIMYVQQLKRVVDKFKLKNSVRFVLSPDDKEKIQLYLQSLIVIYTPYNEHFGIVPLEAMYLEKPVLACNSGGPLETVINKETGFLRENLPNDFRLCMLEAINKPDLMKEMGKKGHQRVLKNFSFSIFTEQLENVIYNCAKKSK